MSKINFYSLKELIKNGLSTNEVDKIVMDILNITLPIKDDYPGYKDWFLNKQVKGINIDRDILFAKYNNEIVGIVNIKNSEEEKKICTIYIKNIFRKNYIGSTLVRMACDKLETNKPLITISSNKIYDYRKIILDNGWELSDELSNYYKEYSNEYVFNGSLFLPAKPDKVKELIKIYSKDRNILKLEFNKFSKLFNIFNYKNKQNKKVVY